MTVFLTLFAAGLVTILLPCILPLIPVVLGVSVVGQNKLRPLVTILGMVISFVAFTFLLQVVLARFVQFADIIQISTYYVLLLFGICFLTGNKTIQMLVAVIGGFFYVKYGWIGVSIAEVAGWLAVEIGGRVASRIQQLGSDVQQAARTGLGAQSLLTAFVIGLTLGLVWVPCAGPALGFALALVRDEPGIKAVAALASYAVGAAVPLLIVGYGGQIAVHSVRAISQYSGRIKQVAGVALILTAIGLQYGWLMTFQVWLADHMFFGTVGTRIEETLFTNDNPMNPSSSSGSMKLPKLSRAPEFTGLGPWHNSKPLTMKELKGKVVLVDFWTYSCINCIRTLPYIQGYWEKFKNMPFVLVGVHTPEFVFEKDQGNVAAAIKSHGLTYPIAQDNDYGTWSAFANHYWPAKYLIDADGYIRYTHFGEGNYQETQEAIESLLAEIGQKMPVTDVTEVTEVTKDSGYRDQSPETYLGARSWPAFANADGDPDDGVHSYVAPETLSVNQYALAGDWQLDSDGEHQTLRSAEGEIRYHALAAEVNLVLGVEDPHASVMADVFVDGKKTKTITIDRHDLFNLFTGPYGEHDVTLKIHGAGVEGYAYTFGS